VRSASDSRHPEARRAEGSLAELALRGMRIVEAREGFLAALGMTGKGEGLGMTG